LTFLEKTVPPSDFVKKLKANRKYWRDDVFFFSAYGLWATLGLGVLMMEMEASRGRDQAAYMFFEKNPVLQNEVFQREGYSYLKRFLRNIPKYPDDLMQVQVKLPHPAELGKKVFADNRALGWDLPVIKIIEAAVHLGVWNTEHDYNPIFSLRFWMSICLITLVIGVFTLSYKPGYDFYQERQQKSLARSFLAENQVAEEKPASQPSFSP
jgi:hypothetical protein